MLNRLIVAALLVASTTAVATALSGCGQKGPLKLPTASLERPHTMPAMLA
jgi:predicted small lipoprotein YifL